MKYLVPIIFSLLYLVYPCAAADTSSAHSIYNKHTQIVSIAMGFPNVVDPVYGEYGQKVIPPLYARYEHALQEEVGIDIGLSYFRKEAMFLYHNGHVKGVGTKTTEALGINPAVNYHFYKLLYLKDADIYASIGAIGQHKIVTYSATRYINNLDENNWRVLPTIKLASLIYIGKSKASIGIAVGYDWTSFMQLSLNYKL